MTSSTVDSSGMLNRFADRAGKERFAPAAIIFSGRAQAIERPPTVASGAIEDRQMLRF